MNDYKLDPVSRLKKQQDATGKKTGLVGRLLSRNKNKGTASVPQEAAAPSPPPPPVEGQGTPPVKFGAAQVPLYRDLGPEAVRPSHALEALVEIALAAAQNRDCTVVLSWPTALTALAPVHALGSFERWAAGDKQGLRTLLYPTKTNVFHPLNHLLVGRERMVEFARTLIEAPRQPNPAVRRGCPDKDTFLFALNSLTRDELARYHPTAGELLPHFLADSGFQAWQSCAETLLQHTTARLARKRAHGKLVRNNTLVLGHPASAPDALFAMSYRMSPDEARRALRALTKLGPPEVALLDATRAVRKSMPAWKAAIGRCVRMLHEELGTRRPGILVLTDEPHIAYEVREEIRKELDKLPQPKKSGPTRAPAISALLCAGLRDGLLSEEEPDFHPPAPRSFKVHLTDSLASKVIQRLYRIARAVGGDGAKPVLEAARYLHRLAALPSSVAQLAAWLDSFGANERVRDLFTWPRYRAGLNEFARTPAGGEVATELAQAVAEGDTVWANYQEATPFALKLAQLVGQAASSPRKIVVVFGNASYRRLAERFLADYAHYPDGKAYADFAGRVSLIGSHELGKVLVAGWGTHYVFAGVDEETLRLMVTDDGLPAHSDVLLTHRAGLYLRALLQPIAQFAEFRCLKPRIESLLQQLDSLPQGNDRAFLSGNDYVLPAFEFGQALESARQDEEEETADAWHVVLEGDRVLYRRPGSEVYVYDLAHHKATDQGYRCVAVRSLAPGDKLFVMTPELRELLESALRQAGVPIEHDKVFEAAVHAYHARVTQCVEMLFPRENPTSRARRLREAMLKSHPALRDLPEESAIRAWVSVDKSNSKAFADTTSQAPRLAPHFQAFAAALGWSDIETAYYWKRVIQPFRGSRRADGRAVSDVYTHMLLEPESVIVHAKLPFEVVKTLFAKARENIHCVEQVIAAQEAPRDAVTH